MNEDLNTSSKLVDDITNSVILYASWTILEYQMSFNLDDGELHVDQVLEFTVFDEVDLLEPEKIGYDFLGWVRAVNRSKRTLPSDVR